MKSSGRSTRFSVTFALFVFVLACSEEPADGDAGRVAPDRDASQPDGDDAGRTDAGVSDAGEPDTPGDWRLPEGHYLPAKMAMTVVHPRNDDASAWAFSKNAHPGVHWEIPIVIQGGAWPFRYEIVDDGGAEGLTIGGELEREEEGDVIVHRVTDSYGVLWWSEPQAGDYEILIRVHDQDDSSVDVPISLTVGSDGWVFIDADHGDDSNDGSRDAPLATVQAIHDRGDDFRNHRVYLRGVVSMAGSGHFSGGQMSVASDSHVPAVWVGMPGEEAVLEAVEGGSKFIVSRPDFYLANLEHRHHEDFRPEGAIHMFTVYDRTDRLTLHDVTFSRFHGRPRNTGLGNSSIIMFTDQGSRRDHVAVVNNTMTGELGVLTSAYQLRHAVFEKNRAVDARFVNTDPSTRSIFYIKKNNELVTLRANEFVFGNVWGTQGNLEAALGLDASWRVEFCYNTIHTTYVESTSWRGGTIKLFTGSAHPEYHWTSETPIWVYRNSLRHRLTFSGGQKRNMADDTVISERNILDGSSADFGLWPEHDRVLDADNLDAADADTYFDDEMALTGAARAAYLGRYGAAIAAPAE